MQGYVYKEKFIKPAANTEGSLWGRDRALKREGKRKEEQKLGGCRDKSAKAYRTMVLRCGFKSHPGHGVTMILR